MKIKSIKAIPVTIDFTETEFWSQGERAAITAVIVELTTDQGLVGIGESVPAPTPEVTLAAIESSSEVLLGRDPREITHRWLDLQNLVGWHSFPYVGNAALAGVEIACWDILGKSLGVPIHVLLGGPIRMTVPVMGFVQHTTPEQIEKDARRMASQGFTTLYTKVGMGFEHDMAAVEALRRGGGDSVEIRVDANEAWAPGTALRMAHALRHLNLQYIEQPLRMRSLEELATFRRRSPIPVAANQATWLNWDVFEILKAGAADIVMTDPWQAGGIANFRRAAALCETAGVPLVYHSFAPLSVATCAAVQVICTSQACMYAHQTYSHMLADDIVLNPIRVENGQIAVSDLPGLGVQLDRDKLDRYHEAYQSKGYATAYGKKSARNGKAFFLPNY
jgi:L-alanine-DL-glutamate epimerase-like enolase superfamily enzyme